MSSCGVTDFRGGTLHAGQARAEVVHLSEPLSFWGGTDAQGWVIDANHPQHGQSISGRVVVMEAGRGSSSSSTVLAEQLRSGHGPAALILGVADPILVVGALVAEELYGIKLPIVTLDRVEMGHITRAVAGSGPWLAHVRAPYGDGSSHEASISLTPPSRDHSVSLIDCPCNSQQVRNS